MNKAFTIFAALAGFAAPLTVAIASGVHFGDASAGWFVASSWFFAILFAGGAQLLTLGES